MYDFTNYQVADIPIFMWSMVGVTAALIGYVTVSSTGLTGNVAATTQPSATPTQLGGSGRKTRRKKAKSC